MSISATPSGTAPPRWLRWLLPAIMGSEDATRKADGGTDLPRSPRDWVVDIVLFGFAVLTGSGFLINDHPKVATTVFVLDALLALPACLSLWFRRRRPVEVGWLATGLALFSHAAWGAALVALFTVAVHSVPRRTLQLAVLSVLDGVSSSVIYAGHDYQAGGLAFSLVMTVGVVAFGLYVRARRELVLSLRERARRAEDEQQLRMREARLAERARIAREMHDVLAHRISLLSVHAGALEFNPGASPEEIARAARVVRVSARAAQEELREVIGVLRAGTEVEDLEAPQPTLADLGQLVDESRRAGMDVSLTSQVEEQTLAPILGRTVYRVIQEALTNVRKHAPGQVVTITLDQDSATGVRVEIVNRPRVGQAEGANSAGRDGEDHVGAGMGLVGLAERVTLVGGKLVSEPLPGGGFRLVAMLPSHGADADEAACD